MEFEKVLKERYSVRRYQEKEIEPNKLTKILEAGINAPSAKNMQPQRIYVLKSKEALEKIKSITKCTYGAPLVLLGCFDKNQSWKNNLSGEDAGVEDVSIACTQIMLAAWNEGIGSCWVNMYDSKLIKKEFALPDNIIPVCLMPMGYIAPEAKPIPMHFAKKDFSEIFTEI